MIKISILKKIKDRISVSDQMWQRWTDETTKLDGDWMVEILIVEPREIKKLNKKFRKKDEVTDVLSFPIFKKLPMPRGPNILGTVIICFEVAQKQARDANQDLNAELKTLYQHGLKHLLGKHHK